MPEISQLLGAMITYYRGDVSIIQHFIQVHDLARTIGILEGLDKDTLYTLEAAAAVHDIGAHICELKYGRCDGELLAQEGPELARDMLTALGFDAKVIVRVCWLVGHRHTYRKADGWDHQILIESECLVTLCEENASRERIEEAYETVFITETGKFFCKKMFDI